METGNYILVQLPNTLPGRECRRISNAEIPTCTLRTSVNETQGASVMMPCDEDIARDAQTTQKARRITNGIYKDNKYFESALMSRWLILITVYARVPVPTFFHSIPTIRNCWQTCQWELRFNSQWKGCMTFHLVLYAAFITERASHAPVVELWYLSPARCCKLYRTWGINHYIEYITTSLGGYIKS